MIGICQTAPILYQDANSNHSYFKANYKPGNENAINNALNLGFDFLLSSSRKEIDQRWSYKPNQSLSDKWKKEFHLRKTRKEQIQKDNDNGTFEKRIRILK